VSARTIKLGEREVTRMGLGTNQLEHTPENVTFIREVVDAGVDHIDSAYLYTGGDSETTIGEALASEPDGVLVATKGGFAPGTGKPDVLRGLIEESLRRLQADSIELYYLHRVDPETPLEESVGLLAEYRDRGVLRHIGLSQVGVEEIERARAVVPITAVQNRYNLAERTYDDVVDHCAREGIVFVPFHPLKGEITEAQVEVAERHGVTAEQVALAWLLQRSPTTLPIPGSLSLEHVQENLAALDLELSAEDLEALA
jgi:aryl-alcohol dehydrogenase-like predicted oxidoreductase